MSFTAVPPHVRRRRGSCGWPTVARLDDGPVLVASSGLRSFHVCPHGKTVLHESRDEGRTWTADWVVRGDGPDWDLGYPSTVELADGSLLTVCYQKAAAEEPCALLWSRWRLPAADPQIASEP